MTTQAPTLPQTGIAWEGLLPLRWHRTDAHTIRYTAFRDAQDIDCPACPACAGGRCVTPSGKEVDFHKKRLDFFKDMPSLLIQHHRFTCYARGAAFEGYAEPHDLTVIVAKALFAAFITTTHPERRVDA